MNLSLADAFDPSAADTVAGLSYAFECGNVYSPFGSLGTATCLAIDDGTATVKAVIRDKDGGETEYAAAVVVANLPPVVGPITAPLTPVQVGLTIIAAANFTDPGTEDTHSAIWDWGDGSTSVGIVTQSSGSGSVDGSHAYATPGVYTIQLTLFDDDGASGQSIFQFVVVYDPEGGFVTGGGWINSPAGAYVAEPSLTGRANFGFVAKYKKGANVPTGQTQFQFKIADVNFHRPAYQWLVVAGARAQYKGWGTINGSGDYGFLLTAIDGQVNGGGGLDKFRIKIWHNTTGVVVYDNQIASTDDSNAATVLGGGSIVIHK